MLLIRYPTNLILFPRYKAEMVLCLLRDYLRSLTQCMWRSRRGEFVETSPVVLWAAWWTGISDPGSRVHREGRGRVSQEPLSSLPLQPRAVTMPPHLPGFIHHPLWVTHSPHMSVCPFINKLSSNSPNLNVLLSIKTLIQHIHSFLC